jgi:hypothetical protein
VQELVPLITNTINKCTSNQLDLKEKIWFSLIFF